MNPRPRGGIHVDVAAEVARVPLARARVAELAAAVLRAERVRAAQVSITFVEPATMAQLNRRHLGHRGATDVITFELAPIPGAPVTGDVYICPDVARDHAHQHGRPVREEIARLVVHAMLHVLGHEHPEDLSRTTSPMWRRQERLLARLLSPSTAPPSAHALVTRPASGPAFRPVSAARPARRGPRPRAAEAP